MYSTPKYGVSVLCIIALVGIVLCGNQDTHASTWAGITPAMYGRTRWSQPPVIIERGDTTVHAFTFTGTIGTSDDDVWWIPSVRLTSSFEADQLFFSLDPEELVTEQDWEPQFVSGVDTHTLSFGFSVYVSRPLMDPTFSEADAYRLRAGWRPKRVDPSGSAIGVQPDIGGVILMQVTPEPTSLMVMALGAFIVLRRRHRGFDNANR